MSIRIGHGYDVHRFGKDRELWLGCVKIPYEMGLIGHSDADVAVHAVIDALFGACGVGDIGAHFPDTDARYEGISGEKLLTYTASELGELSAEIINIDVTVIAQAPKLMPYIPEMKEKIAAALGIASSLVNVKATTEEKLCFTGRLEGISAHAVCLIDLK